MHGHLKRVDSAKERTHYEEHEMHWKLTQGEDEGTGKSKGASQEREL
jgi:hypothetical protein